MSLKEKLMDSIDKKPIKSKEMKKIVDGNCAKKVYENMKKDIKY